MPKEKIPFEAFIAEVDDENVGFVKEMHAYFLENNCAVKIEQAKSGYVASYIHQGSKKVVMNYVFRKKGIVSRIYGDHAPNYFGFLSELPEKMIAAIEKAPLCKRMINPDKCNSRCPMGYDFLLNGSRHQKCRYNCFMFELNGENNPHIKRFVEHELGERTA